MNTITISKKSIKDGLVILEKEKFERMCKENMELRLAIKAILEGEKALFLGKTRSFKEFLKAKLPEYVKNR